VLMTGAAKPVTDAAKLCQDPDTNYYYEATGYRRIPASTCQDGLVLDQGKRHYCPGKSAPRWGHYLLALILVLLVGAVLMIVYGRWRTAGYYRLGEDDFSLRIQGLGDAFSQWPVREVVGGGIQAVATAGAVIVSVLGQMVAAPLARAAAHPLLAPITEQMSDWWDAFRMRWGHYGSRHRYSRLGQSDLAFLDDEPMDTFLEQFYDDDAEPL